MSKVLEKCSMLCVAIDAFSFPVVEAREDTRRQAETRYGMQLEKMWQVWSVGEVYDNIEERKGRRDNICIYSRY